MNKMIEPSERNIYSVRLPVRVRNRLSRECAFDAAKYNIYRIYCIFERRNRVDVPLEFQEDDKNKYNKSVNSDNNNTHSHSLRKYICSLNGTALKRTNVGV